jgi:NADPH:quinone reductase-like Zn-dependent oxidoreductase
MFQVFIERHGGPEVLRYREQPSAAVGDDSVSIAVNCAGVNFADVMARMGLYPDAPAPPLVPGYEVAGVVEDVGPRVDHLRRGDRVLALTRFGGYSTHVVVPAPYVFPISARVTDIDAAALPVNYLTASLALYRLANLAAGETVLIHGAGGGVGIAAMQLAKLRHATVVGTAGRDKHDRLRSLGADYLVDSRQSLDRVAAEIRQIVGRRGVDVVLDPVGGRSFRLSYQLLAPLGRLVIYGVSAIAPGERRSW